MNQRGRSPFSARFGFVVDSVDKGLAAVDWYAAHGYHAIKLYNSIKPEWVQPLAAHARSRGLRVSGHVPAFMRAEQAVRASEARYRSVVLALDEGVLVFDRLSGRCLSRLGINILPNNARRTTVVDSHVVKD